MPGLRIDAAAHVLERHREIARDSGNECIGVAERDHAGSEMVAVLVDQAGTIALQEAFALQPLVEIIGIGIVALGEGGIDDFDAAAKLDAEAGGGLSYALLPADQECRTEPLV